MGFDHNGPKRAKNSDATCGQAAVRWDDAEEVQRWFEAMDSDRTQTTKFASPSTAR